MRTVLIRLKKQKCIPSAEGMGVALTIALAASSEILEKLLMSPENTGGGREDWLGLGCLFPPAMAPWPLPTRNHLRQKSLAAGLPWTFRKHRVYGGFPGILRHPRLHVVLQSTSGPKWSESGPKWTSPQFG